MRELGDSVFGTTTLGAIISALERCAQNADVQYDFCYLRPTTVSSYRGYYDHLAIGWSSDSPAGERHWPSVKDVLATLRSALGNTFEGWKGGNYTMTLETPLWVANPGQTGGTGIVGIEDDDQTVILVTKKVD